MAASATLALALTEGAAASALGLEVDAEVALALVEQVAAALGEEPVRVPSPVSKARFPAASFARGDAVEANFAGEGTWYAAAIAAANADGTYAVDYEDGEHEAALRTDALRKKASSSSANDALEEESKVAQATAAAATEEDDDAALPQPLYELLARAADLCAADPDRAAALYERAARIAVRDFTATSRANTYLSKAAALAS